MENKNKYVSFVSDEDFLECVSYVCSAYTENAKNVLDPIKALFDVLNRGLTVETWNNDEEKRLRDKKVNNRIGEFHQRLLGKVEGWEDLGRGHPTKLDLKKTDGSIYIELKNKFNTLNSGGESTLRKNLEKVLDDHPKAKICYAYIISENGDSGKEVWVYKGKENKNILKIWGKDVYELVTGNPNAINELWKALPLAIKDCINCNVTISKKDNKKLNKYFKEGFYCLSGQQKLVK
jgi:hypothetical protein